MDILPSLVDAHYRAGNIKTALASATETHHRPRGSQAIIYRKQILELLGRIHSHPDCYQPEMARTCFRDGIGSATEQGARVTIAHCHAGLGRLHHTMGEESKAKEELTRACDMYREMEMTYYLRKAEEDLAGLG